MKESKINPKYSEARCNWCDKYESADKKMKCPYGKYGICRG